MQDNWRHRDENEYRCAVVLDESYAVKGKLLGAMAHGLLGLSANREVYDKGVVALYDDSTHQLTSTGFHYACLILSARTQTEMKSVIERARRKNVPRSEVVEDMMVGTTEEQYTAVISKPSSDHIFLALAMFDTTKIIKGIVGSLPLYRG